MHVTRHGILFVCMWPHLDEHARRLMAASKAVELAYGGISRVSRACAASRKSRWLLLILVQTGVAAERLRRPAADADILH
jgi:hypothetical protein